jgi:hypothetical protein
MRRNSTPAHRTAAGAVAMLALLAGCQQKVATLTPELQAGMMSDLQAGKMTLDCGLKCHFTWVAQVPQINTLDTSEHWTDLAVRVMQIGYGSDLAYYYLGQAAQGLGYHNAAIAYYTTALGIATGPDPLAKCEGTGGADNICQGVDLVAAVPQLIQASRDAIAQQQADAAAAARPAPVVHHRKPKPKPASNWVAPPPPASGSTAAPASGGSGWVAPPPPSTAPAQ